MALGGQTDKDGAIDASRLIDIIKHEFEMTIDIEKLIQEIDDDGSGLIEYDEFMSLLSSSDWNLITLVAQSVIKSYVEYRYLI